MCLWKMTCKDPKVSLRNEERLDVCFYGLRKKKLYYHFNYIVQASEHCVRNALNIGEMSSKLDIFISIFTVGGFRYVSSKDFSDCFPPKKH